MADGTVSKYTQKKHIKKMDREVSVADCKQYQSTNNSQQ